MNETPSAKSHIAAYIIIAISLILGGLYLWGSQLVREEKVSIPQEEVLPPNNEPETPRARADVQNMSVLSTSDSREAIEADLSATTLDSFEADLQGIENELRLLETN